MFRFNYTIEEFWKESWSKLIIIQWVGLMFVGVLPVSILTWLISFSVTNDRRPIGNWSHVVAASLSSAFVSLIVSRHMLLWHKRKHIRRLLEPVTSDYPGKLKYFKAIKFEQLEDNYRFTFKVVGFGGVEVDKNVTQVKLTWPNEDPSYYTVTELVKARLDAKRTSSSAVIETAPA
jgi:hypothetical protein